MKKKVLLASFFWIVYYCVLLQFYSRYTDFAKAVYISTIVITIQSVLIYINLWICIPLFLKKKRFAIYVTAILFSIAVLTMLRFSFPAFLGDEGKRIIAMRVKIGLFVFNLLLTYFVSTAYYFVFEWFRNVQLKAEMKYLQAETELKYLRNQINPHFLFNTLNNIYTLCYLKDDKAAPAVMKLSEMMRYMLHDSNTSLIELEREIQFIRNYIELQQLKKEEAMYIQFSTLGVKGRHKIAPLLLIAFFENCFKHGDIETNSQGWIKACLEVDSTNNMMLTIANSKRSIETVKNHPGNVGLVNVKQRLELLYPNKYQLKVVNNENLYQVSLTLKLDV